MAMMISDTGFGQLSGVGMDDAHIGTTNGITVTHSDPLPLATFPTATLPAQVDVALVGGPTAITPAKLWTLQKLGLGMARFELGDDYALGFNEMQREVTIENRATKETTRVFGNAEVEVDGQKAFQFWGTTSFELANGVKITANTVQSPENTQAYMLDKLTITNDDRAVIITGVNDAVVGDLVAVEKAKPWIVDKETRDGFVLEENIKGAGWESEYTDEVATQADLDETAVGGDFGPNSAARSLSELGAIFMQSLNTWTMPFAFTTRNESFDTTNHSRNNEDKCSFDKASSQKRAIEMQQMRLRESMPDVSQLIAMEARAA
jgi:hypothetical protein